MKYSRLGTLLLVLATVIVTGVMVYSGHPPKVSAQGAERTLDIERYASEPFALVAINIGGQQLKDKTVRKFQIQAQGLDSVKFKERADWHKRVWLRLRNISGQPIMSFGAYLYFKPPGTQNIFSMPLTRSRRIKGGPLRAGDEIDLTVSFEAYRLTAAMLKHYGADLELAAVSFSVQNVAFSDSLQWSKGHLLNRDPNSPNRWNTIDSETHLLFS